MEVEMILLQITMEHAPNGGTDVIFSVGKDKNHLLPNLHKLFGESILELGMELLPATTLEEFKKIPKIQKRLPLDVH